MMEETFQIHPNDNVAVALHQIGDVPAGHKIALKDIDAGEKIIKYGYPIGAATEKIPKDTHVHVHNVRTLLSETPTYSYKDVPQSVAPVTGHIPDIQVFKRPDGQIGIRNDIWIIPTVGCVNRTAETLARWADAEFADSGIDGVYAWTHPYGCSQMGDDHKSTQAILADLAKHPNAGAVLIVGLGCENNTIEQFKSALGDYADDEERIAFLIAQQCDDEIEAGKKLLEKLAGYAKKAKRESAKFSDLIIGMKCGGSDGFSGITANALVGQVCDEITGMGGSAILTEVPEMFGAEQMLMDRCESREVFDKTVSLVEGFKEYYRAHNQVVYDNPSPGNKAGGITTLEDKSCGCVQKGGKATIRGVYRYGERVAGGVRGLSLLEGPGNDIVSSTAMTAGGAHLILFTTGRGTPLGAPVPVVKIASNSELARNKAKWIDFDAGRMLSDESLDAIRTDLLQLIADVASGVKKTKNELNGYREIAIFKNGVTL